MGPSSAGYATLGIIPIDVVAAWLNELVSNPSFQAGVVRWTPTVASKCSNNVLGCTKSVSITVRPCMLVISSRLAPVFRHFV